jgi:hypothetical protein
MYWSVEEAEALQSEEEAGFQAGRWKTPVKMCKPNEQKGFGGILRACSTVQNINDIRHLKYL